MQEKSDVSRLHQEGVVYHAPCLYHFFLKTICGRLLIRPIISRPVSFLVGVLLDSPLSKLLIKSFIRKNKIDTSQFEDRKYRSYNDYFMRKIKPGMRTFSDDVQSFCAPCDSFLSVYRIEEGSIFPVKESLYTVADILDDDMLAKEYEGGICLIFRLSVSDYHRYAFLDSGRVLNRRTIRGKFHTVQPFAVEKIPVFHRNTREWTLLQTDHFGKMIYAEIGALLVGRICNHTEIEQFSRGQEKGCFAYGGSTVICLLQKDTISVDREIWDNTAAHLETPVKQGEVIGHAENGGVANE